MLSDFHIQNFRCFRDLRLSGLGRVNLLVGKNNTGKTTVLEALSLWAKNGDPREIGSILNRRGLGSADPEEWPGLLRALFLSANPSSSRCETVLGPDSDMLRVTFGLRTQHNWLDHADVAGPGAQWSLGYAGLHDLDNPVVSSIEPVFVPPRATFPWRARWKSLFIPSDGLSEAAVGALWRGVAGHAAEDDLVAALQILEPDVQRVIHLADASGAGAFRLRRAGRNVPEPLDSLGDGMRRVLEFALALPTARDGLLLIDEFELGIHFEAHEPLWRWLIAIATRLDVQIVATTHSLDCVRGFTAAIADHPAEGTLYRLDRRRGEILAFVLDERDLVTAAQQGMEVR